MKLDPTKTITDLDGDDIQDAGAPLTFKGVAVRALLAGGREPLSGEENMRRFSLAKKLHDAGGLIDVTAEEAALIKAQVAASFAPIVVGRVYELIEA